MRRPLGCMTFSALVAGILAVLAIVVVTSLAGHSMFSPGGLSAFAQPGAATTSALGGVRSHAELGDRCEACHAPIWSGQRMGDRCLACHGDVARQASTGTGLHAHLDANASTCLRCHTEHHGPDAATTLADPSVFPHDQAGFVLTAHLKPATDSPVGCRQCHPGSPKDYAAPAPATTCVTCHQQRDAAKMTTHVATFGAACLNCHDGRDSFGRTFAHTTYALTGKHASATCASCHAGSTTLAALRATSTACASCHQKDDPHGGRLGASCGSCHTPAGWAGATLDHTTQTTFPLTGKHTSVACESCHVNRQWSGIGTSCAACHQKDDPHQGKFGSDCASCHTPASWQGATFDHSETGFPLVASHSNVACASCHQGDKFAGTPTACVACHAGKDKHNGVLGTTCEQCHKPTQWSDVSFDHSSAPFKLAGAHAGASCEQCHKSGPPQSTSTACTSCHGRPASHDSHFGSNCSTCHTTTAWTPAPFDHNTTSYKLTGAHLSVTCLRCHASPTTTFAGAPTICASCHSRPASHTAVFGSICSTCHTTRAWLPASFDHSKTSFLLTGAHTSLVCAKCHTTPHVFTGLSSTCGTCHARPADHTSAFSSNCATCHSTSAWQPSTFNHSATGWALTGAHTSLLCTRCHSGTTFSGLSTTCASCHSRPSDHPSGYTTCNQCHTTSVWTPIHYTGSHTFPMSHGGANGLCWTCHPSTTTSYTCNKCHSDSSMISKHQGVSGFSLTTCAKCHPTGGGGG